MKQEYLNNLSQEFDNKGISVETYSQIVDKYRTWYEKLESDGKSDEEIHNVLKSPAEVATIFAEKFSENTVQVENKVEVENKDVVQEDLVFEQKAEPVAVINQENQNNNQQTFTPNYIVKTNSRGKQKFFEKRTFGGKVGIFLLFILASSLCLPILFGLFSLTLTFSFAFMLLFFTPFYYLFFIWRYDTVSYIQSAASNGPLGVDVLTLPIDKINDIISYLNQMTSFDFPVFLQAILLSIFGFAGLLLSLYLCLTMFRVNVAYFSWFFNKVSLKRVKDKDMKN